jgi:hypothetical protein
LLGLVLRGAGALGLIALSLMRAVTLLGGSLGRALRRLLCLLDHWGKLVPRCVLPLFGRGTGRVLPNLLTSLLFYGPVGRLFDDLLMGFLERLFRLGTPFDPVQNITGDGLDRP